ncbi:MAG TPA: CDF family Co(II)/Ni(II) efflux transporter DmeF [Roseiarcus sp.]
MFLGEDHARGERNVWAVIALTSAMMVAEIVGGAMFGSIALVADGLHMSTHAGALLLAAIAYTMARRRVGDSRFTFGTGKFGDLAGFASAIVLAMIAALVAYESIGRLFAPTPIAFGQAIPIAFLGLVVNAASAWLLSRGGHEHHHHGHGHAHDHAHGHDEAFRLAVAGAPYELSVFEEGVPPRFRLRALGGQGLDAAATSLELVRPNGARETYAMVDRGGFLESENAIPEPHQFAATLRIGAAAAQCDFVEHGRAKDSVHRDNNLRAAVIHVMADATVSIFVIVGLLLARGFGWLWMDPVAGLLGAGVIVSWSVGLVRDTSAVLLDMNPDAELTRALRAAVEREGDRLVDLHIWRLGPGHLGAILSVETDGARDASYYRDLVLRVRRFSHLTVEVARRGAAERPTPRFA